jgi:Na+/H+-dicarboxylate symporter
MGTANFNLVCDILGLIAFVLCAAYSGILLLKADDMLKETCKEIGEDWKTLHLNTIGLCYSIFVLAQWIGMKVNTAPNALDIQILFMELIILAVITRSSTAAYKNILDKCREAANGC